MPRFYEHKRPNLKNCVNRKIEILYDHVGTDYQDWYIGVIRSVKKTVLIVDFEEEHGVRYNVKGKKYKTYWRILKSNEPLYDLSTDETKEQEESVTNTGEATPSPINSSRKRTDE